MRLSLAALPLSLFLGALSASGAAANELSISVKNDYDSYLAPLFEHFHRNPELSEIETETAARMAQELRGGDFASGTALPAERRLMQ
ncbi:MAG: amidohydrolase, partial [Pseudomonadota bacterium]